MARLLPTNKREMREEIHLLEEQIEALTHEHKLELSKLRRDNEYTIAELKEKFAAVDAQNDTLLAMNGRLTEISKKEFAIAQSQRELDHINTLFQTTTRLEEARLEKARKALERDRVEFEADKKNGFSHAYDLGTAEGFHNGFVEGIDVMMRLQDSHVDFAKLQALVSAQLGQKGTEKPSKAAQELADSFAKHLNGTIEKLLDQPKNE